MLTYGWQWESIISAVSNYFSNLETQAENAEFDLWRCWSFLTGLSAPWVDPLTPMYKFHMGEKDHLGTDLIVKVCGILPQFVFLDESSAQ